MSKLTINDKDLLMIKEYAKDAFKRRPTFLGLESDETQIYCILVGIHSFLSSKGLGKDFEVAGFIQEDCEPIDDGGLSALEIEE